MEMVEIFGKKKNIHPEILLDSNTIDSSIEMTCEEELFIESKTATQQLEITPKVIETPKASSVASRRLRPTAKKSAVEKARQDRKDYYEAKLQIEREKLEEMKRRNNLISERNQILKDFKCNCQYSSIL